MGDVTPDRSSDDLAAIIALGVSLGDDPDERQIGVLREHGYWNGRGLTVAGWEAASDASGFKEDC